MTMPSSARARYAHHQCTRLPCRASLEDAAARRCAPHPVISRGGTLSRDVLCFSHLRWDFVYQRPNHLMARRGADRRVFFFEEPTFEDITSAGLDLVERGGVTVVTPRLPQADRGDPRASLRRLVDDLVRSPRSASRCSGTTPRWRCHGASTWTARSRSSTAWTMNRTGSGGDSIALKEDGVHDRTQPVPTRPNVGIRLSSVSARSGWSSRRSAETGERQGAVSGSPASSASARSPCALGPPGRDRRRPRAGLTTEERRPDARARAGEP